MKENITEFLLMVIVIYVSNINLESYRKNEEIKNSNAAAWWGGKLNLCNVWENVFALRILNEGHTCIHMENDHLKEKWGGDDACVIEW